MIIHLDSPSELKQVTDYFGIPMNLAEVTVSFPFPFEFNDLFLEREELTFQEFEEKYLNKKSNAI